jgi:hypothetical protein
MRKRRASGVEKDLEALLARMHQRMYPETIPVLASYWLKTVYWSGYNLRRWKQLNGLLRLALRGPLRDGTSQQAIVDIQNWIQKNVLQAGSVPEHETQGIERVGATVKPEHLAVHVGRLLNEWLPIEVARLLIGQSEYAVSQQDGIPILAIASAIENLLTRERLSPGTLEMLLDSKFLSPEGVYPAHLEILQDIVLSLLGRTSAPAPSVLPAALLAVAPDSNLPMEYADCVHRALMVQRSGGDEIHVPIGPVETLDILKRESVRIGSIVVTMDGRWWEPINLQSGVRQFVVYRPFGRLRIEYSGEHATLKVAWPVHRLHWSGGVRSIDTFKIFGREWRTADWEVDNERTWLNLVFSRVLPITEIASCACTALPRLRPACVDMEWAALERALTSSLAEKGGEAVERLYHPEFVPLGRAILKLIELMRSRRPVGETIENQLAAIRYLQSPLSETHGRVPWKILPEETRTAFVRARRYLALGLLLTEVFEGVPEALSQTTEVRAPSSAAAAHAA